MRAEQKRIALGFLRSRDWTSLRGWTRTNRRALATLYSLMYDPDELVKWRAIEATGIAARVKADRDLDRVRDFIRRCIWLMNDESGGLGWHSPEVIGEVLVNVPELIAEYGGLLPHYFFEEPFERGAVIAVSRVGGLAPSLISEHADELMTLLGDADPGIRFHALRALKKIDTRLPDALVQRLSRDSDEVSVYDFENGHLERVSVAGCLSGKH